MPVFTFMWQFLYFVQHCFICRPSDLTVSEDACIEPRTVATSVLAVRRSNHSAKSHPNFLAFYWSTGLGRFRQKLDLESYWLEGFANWTPTPKNYKNSANFSLYAASSKPISFNHWAIIPLYHKNKPLLLQFQPVFAFTNTYNSMENRWSP
jgi:hypothetical protein